MRFLAEVSGLSKCLQQALGQRGRASGQSSRNQHGRSWAVASAGAGTDVHDCPLRALIGWDKRLCHCVAGAEFAAKLWRAGATRLTLAVIVNGRFGAFARGLSTGPVANTPAEDDSFTVTIIVAASRLAAAARGLDSRDATQGPVGQGPSRVQTNAPSTPASPIMQACWCSLVNQAPESHPASSNAVRLGLRCYPNSDPIQRPRVPTSGAGSAGHLPLEPQFTRTRCFLTLRSGHTHTHTHTHTRKQASPPQTRCVFPVLRS